MNHKGFQDYGNIFTFFTDRIKSNGVFSRAGRLVKYTRRYFFFSRLIKYMSTVIAFIETSATLVILSTVLLVSIPVTFLILGAGWLVGLYHNRKFDPTAERMLEGDGKVMFIFSARGFNSKKSGFLRGMAADFANDGYTVFVVSDAPFCDRFITASEKSDSLCVIKLNYFYRMKKKYLSMLDQSRLTYIS